jgi:folate-dependent phosphoribosylglycinamide formyltransferase PurN
LLPKYPGLHTHQRALAAGDQEHGCTVHYVTKVLDAGPVIDQARVPILDSDTEITLAVRVLEQEHKIYPIALSVVADKLRKSL